MNMDTIGVYDVKQVNVLRLTISTLYILCIYIHVHIHINEMKWYEHLIKEKKAYILKNNLLKFKKNISREAKRKIHVSVSFHY